MAATLPRLVCVLVGLVVAQGCARHQSFQPTERVEGYTVEGFQQAFYDLAEGGQTYGEVKVWSSGADLVDTAQGKVTNIKVGFTIDNGGDQQVTLAADRVRLESVQTRDGDSTQLDLPASSITGDAVVPPNTTGTLYAEFRLSGAVKPGDIRAFRIRWTTWTDGQEFTEFTPFVQQIEYAYVPVWGYYYPYYPFDYPYYDPWYTALGPSDVTIVPVAPYPRRVVVRGHLRQ